MSPIPADTLLDPKNDYVFFRVFSEEPDLPVDLINVVRRDEPAITEVKLLNPRLPPERLSGKHVLHLVGIPAGRTMTGKRGGHPASVDQQ